MKKLFTLFTALLLTGLSYSQTVIWEEDFEPANINGVDVNNIGDGLELLFFPPNYYFIVTNYPAETKWAAGESNISWDETTPTTFSVQSDGNGGQNFKINKISKSNANLAGEVIWESDTIDVSAYEKFTCSLDFAKDAASGYASTDFFKVQFELVGGTTFTFNKTAADLNSGALTETLQSSVFLTSGLTDLYIVVTALNSTSNAYYIDNVKVEEYTDPSILIREVQYTTDPGVDGTYPSPLLGETVTLRGVVTAVRPAVLGVKQGYFIQDEDGTLTGNPNGSGNWSGIFIYDQVNTVAEGDAILVTGEVVEINGRTEIHLTDEELGHGASIESTGNDVPLANLIVGPLEEKDESVLSTLRYYQSQGSLPAPLLFTAGIGEVNDPEDTSSYLIIVDKKLYKSPFVPAMDPESLYEQLDGIVNYESGTFRLSPRYITDFYGLVTVPVSVDETSSAANKIVAFDQNIIINAANVSKASIYNLSGQLVKQLNVEAGTTEVPMNAGIYIVKLNSDNTITTEKVIIK